MSSSARHPSPLTGLLVNAAELLRRPGNWKDVEIDVESKHFEFEDPRLLPQLVGIHLHLECSNNGIVLSGNVSAQWESQCCRCLKDISGVVDYKFFMVYSGTDRIIGANIKSKVGSGYFVPLETLESLELIWDGDDYIITNIIKQNYTSLNAKDFLSLDTGVDPLFNWSYIERNINNIV